MAPETQPVRHPLAANAPAVLVIVAGVLLAVAAGLAVAARGPLALLVVLAVYGAVLLISWLPEWPLAILVAGMPLWLLLPDSLASLTRGLAVPLTLAAAIVSLAGYRLRRGQRLLQWPQPRAADLWLLGFTAWLAVSLLWTTNPAYGLAKVLGFTAYTVGGYFIVRWSYHPAHFRIERLAWLIVVAGCAHAALLAYIAAQAGAWLPSQGLSYRNWYLQTRLGLDVISESIALCYGFLAAGWLLRHPAQRRGLGRRLVLWAALLAQLWAILAHQQRSATVVVALTVFCLLAYRPGRRTFLAVLLNRRFWLLAMPGLLVLALAFLALNPDWNVGAFGADVNVQSRLAYYGAALDAVASQPVLGSGAGGMTRPDTPVVVDGWVIYAPSQTQGGSRFYVHNRILEVAAEAGLVGLALLLGFTVAVLHRFDRLVRGGYAVAAYVALFGVIAFLQQWAVAMFSTDLTTWNIGLWAAIVVEMHDWRKALG